MIYVVALLAVLASLALAVARALIGPTAFDRLVAANSIGTSAVMLLALFGFFTGRPEFLDIGLTYVLLNLVGILAVLKFFRYGPLGHAQDLQSDGLERRDPRPGAGG